MDAYLAFHSLVAAEARIAQPVASRRHIHLAARPMVVCAYHLAGDEGAPIAFLYGSTPEAPNLIAIAEPRNRDLRFRALERFATYVEGYLGAFFGRRPVLDDRGREKTGRGGERMLLAIDAPQLIVPNSATVEWLATLARSVVWLRTDGDYPVAPVLPRFGAHLAHLAGRRAIAGSANLVAATELLDLHWVTGQTDAEDASLTTLLSWIDPDWLDEAWFPAGTELRALDAVGAAHLAETLPSSGPIPEPTWDEHELAAAVSGYNRAVSAGIPEPTAAREVADAVVEALTPTWTATWRAIELTRTLPEAASVSRRWESDRRAWTGHITRVEQNRAWFRRYRSVIQSARLLARSEEASAAVMAEMAFDDPLIMARAVASGTAVDGTVVAVNATNHRPGPSGQRLVARPLVQVRPHEPCLQPIGTTFTSAANPKLRLTVTDVAVDGLLTLMITAGVRSPLPEPGQEICLSTFFAPTAFPDVLPDAVPWTHLLPPPPEEETA
jgi:hypothetical protein